MTEFVLATTVVSYGYLAYMFVMHCNDAMNYFYVFSLLGLVARLLDNFHGLFCDHDLLGTCCLHCHDFFGMYGLTW